MSMFPESLQSKTAGLILAGGRGERMGGVDKAMLDYRGQPLIAHVSRLLSRQLPHIYISRQADQRDVSEFGEVIVDHEADAGPLAGVLAGIEAARVAGFDYLATIPTDCSHFPDDLIAQLFEARAPHAIVEMEGRLHPTFALYDLRQCDAAFRAFEEGKRSLRHWLEGAGYNVIKVLPKSLSNINRVDELKG